MNNMEWIAPLLQMGVAGCVLAWFMLRYEPRSKAMEQSLDRMARSIIILIVSIPQVNAAAKDQAKIIQNEIDEAERNREK